MQGRCFKSSILLRYLHLQASPNRLGSTGEKYCQHYFPYSLYALNATNVTDIGKPHQRMLVGFHIQYLFANVFSLSCSLNITCRGVLFSTSTLSMYAYRISSLDGCLIYAPHFWQYRFFCAPESVTIASENAEHFGHCLSILHFTILYIILSSKQLADNVEGPEPNVRS